MEHLRIPTDENYRSPIALPPVPRVPPTPRARPLESISIEARDRFAGIIWISQDPDRPIEDYFTEYDNFEPYSETKLYSKRPYQAVYSGMLRDYQNYLCVVDDGTHESHYVVAKRLPSSIEALIPYCNCTTCAASTLNPCKYIWCASCTRCLKAGPGLADPAYVNLAHTRRLEAQNEAHRTDPWSIFRRRLRTYKWIKILEIGFCLVLFLIMLSWSR